MSWLARVAEAMESNDDKEPTMSTGMEKILASRRKSVAAIDVQLSDLQKDYESLPAASPARAVVKAQIDVVRQRYVRVLAEVKALEAALVDPRQTELGAKPRK